MTSEVKLPNQTLPETEDDNFVSDVSAHNSSLDSARMCFTCEESILETDVYRCQTCAKDDAIYCEACITSPHLKRSHKVMDYRGFEPVVCDIHRMLCLLFCETCSTVFCFKCVSSHQKHDFVPVSQKAKTVRKLIFEYMDRVEEISKPLKKYEHNVSLVQEQSNLFHRIVDEENLAGTLSNKFRQVIEEKAVEWKKVVDESGSNDNEALSKSFEIFPCTFSPSTTAETSESDGPEEEFVEEEDWHLPVLNNGKDIETLSKQVDEALLKMRNMLQMCEASSIVEFLKQEKNVKCLLNGRMNSEESHIVLQWNPTVDQVVEFCVWSSLTMIRKSEVLGYEWMSASPVSSCTYSKKKLKVNWNELIKDRSVLKPKELEGSVIDFVGASIEENGVILKFILQKRNKSGSTSYCVVNFILQEAPIKEICGWYGFVILQTDTGVVYLLDIRDYDCMKYFEMDAKFKPLQFHFRSDRVTSYTDWDPNEGRLIFRLPDPGFIPCEKQPKMVKKSGFVYFIVNGDNSITLFNFESQLKIDVLPVHHQLNQVDQLILKDGNSFLVFDYKAKVGLRSRFSLEDFHTMNWVIVDVLKLFNVSGEIQHVSQRNRSIMIITNTEAILFDI